MKPGILNSTFSLGLLVSVLALSSHAENWPQWRGPNFNGSTKESGLPESWTTESNVVWKAALPGPAGATPVVWGDRVFVASPDAAKRLLLLCFDLKSGKQLWEKEVAIGDRSTGQGNNMVSPSPVTDGKMVFALYGTSDLAAFDLDGNLKWSRNIGKEFGRFADMWLYGSSPLLLKGKLYVQVLQRDDPSSYAHAVDDKPQRESYLLCIDPNTGKDLWRHVRKTDAIVEAQESYATPIPYEGKEGTQIIIVGGDYVTAHNPDTGAEIWRCGGLNLRHEKFWRVISSAVTAPGFIYSSSPKRDPFLAIKEGGHGDITKTHVAWQFKDFPPDVCTPLYYQGKLFLLDGDKKMMICLDPVTGAKKWQGDLEVREVFKSSPTGADGKIYCVSERGTAVVLDAGDQFKILSVIKMDEGPIRSTIVAANGRLLIRTAQNLYCIGKK
jgi:outer membrane protein assembly factor BamB